MADLSISDFERKKRSFYFWFWQKRKDSSLAAFFKGNRFLHCWFWKKRKQKIPLLFLLNWKERGYRFLPVADFERKEERTIFVLLFKFSGFNLLDLISTYEFENKRIPDMKNISFDFSYVFTWNLEGVFMWLKNTFTSELYITLKDFKSDLLLIIKELHIWL